MSDAELSKEQQIMRAMRKTLTSIVRDTAPRDGNPSPLSTETVENIRMCLGLISAREAELADALGLSRNERPHYADEAPAAQPDSITACHSKATRVMLTGVAHVVAGEVDASIVCRWEAWCKFAGTTAEIEKLARSNIAPGVKLARNHFFLAAKPIFNCTAQNIPGLRIL